MTILDHNVAGTGEPLVLLNGGMMSWTAWEDLARPLIESFRLIRCDFRGQLRSAGPPPANFHEHADDVARLMDHLGVESAHVVGASFGGEVALILAARYPRRVRTLTVFTVVDRWSDELMGGLTEMRRLCRIAVNGGPREPVYDMIADAAYSDAWRAANADFIAQRRKLISLVPASWFQGLDGLLASMEDLDLTPLLPTITCPTLVVTAGEDHAMPRERSEAVGAGIPGAERILVPGAGHALIIERLPDSVEIIKSFVARAGNGSKGAAHIPPG